MRLQSVTEVIFFGQFNIFDILDGYLICNNQLDLT